MPKTAPKPEVSLYKGIAAKIAAMIDSGAMPVGSRAPSVRKLAEEFNVSIATVIAAYRALEDEGRLEPRAKSGFYVRALRRQQVDEPEMTRPPEEARAVTVGELGMRLLAEFGQPGIVPLGAAMGAVSDRPIKTVNALMNTISRSQPMLTAAYAPPNGMLDLRRHVAHAYTHAGCAFSPDDVLITCGALEAIHLCLRAVTRPGDTVAVESPTYWGILQTLEMLHLKALEIPTHPRTGVSLDALDVVLSQNLAKAVVLIPTVHNPLGSIMPEENRRRLVEMVTRANVPLIEDDIYADLTYAPARPHTVRSFDPRPSSESMIMVCGGASKTVATGLRIGWCMPGKYYPDVLKLKAWLNIASPTLPQLALAQFMESGAYDRHLRHVRSTYRTQVECMSELVAQHFPMGTKFTRPEGGFLLWVELPAGVDSIDLHHRALKQKVSICPGVVFSATGKYRNHVRLNCGMPWTPQIEPAVATLGRILAEMADQA